MSIIFFPSANSAIWHKIFSERLIGCAKLKAYLLCFICLHFPSWMIVCLLLGEPNNSSVREDCIEAGGDGYWNDIDCYIKFREQWHGKLYYLCNKL